MDFVALTSAAWFRILLRAFSTPQRLVDRVFSGVALYHALSTYATDYQIIAFFSYIAVHTVL